jgi:hypothetical protein
MSAFVVQVRTERSRFTYSAIGTDSAAVLMNALERFGACAVTVTPAPAKQPGIAD